MTKASVSVAKGARAALRALLVPVANGRARGHWTRTHLRLTCPAAGRSDCDRAVQSTAGIPRLACSYHPAMLPSLLEGALASTARQPIRSHCRHARVCHGAERSDRFSARRARSHRAPSCIADCARIMADVCYLLAGVPEPCVARAPPSRRATHLPCRRLSSALVVARRRSRRGPTTHL